MSGSEEETLGVLAANGARIGGMFSCLTDVGANAAEFPVKVNGGAAAVLALGNVIGDECDRETGDGPPPIKRDAIPAITLRSLAAPPGANAAIVVRGR